MRLYINCNFGGFVTLGMEAITVSQTILCYIIANVKGTYKNKIIVNMMYGDMSNK